MSPPDFIAAIAGAAQASAAMSGIPASFTIAEAALESGWGSSQLALQAMNLFGVKADASWAGPTVSMQTREYINGETVTVPATWRAYTGWQGCMDDHATVLHANERYAAAFQCTDGIAFARAIAAAGYATDPDYADKLASIINAHNLVQYDGTPS